MFIHGSYRSQVLQQKRPFTAVLPEDPTPCTRSVVLLHGVGTDETEWAENAPLAEWAERFDTAFLCPSGENSFYTDHGEDQRFGEAIGVEFLEVMGRVFSLDLRREQVSIAGFSMGGYGAVRLGLRYAKRYARIGGFSPAFIFYKEKRHEPTFERVFVRGLYGSENDCAHLWCTLAESAPDLLPQIRLSCGTDDPLLKPTREFFEAVRTADAQADITLVEQPGFHDFSLWRPDLLRFLEETGTGEGKR